MSDAEPGGDLLEACRLEVEAHRPHPAIARWLRAVREVEIPMPGVGVGCFPVVEFRDGRLGAVIWSDGPGTWGTGGWHPLPRSGALPPEAIRVRPVAYGLAFPAALDALVALREAVAPPRPWWRFWG